jgi:hypothetical protein
METKSMAHEVRELTPERAERIKALILDDTHAACCHRVKVREGWLLDALQALDDARRRVKLFGDQWVKEGRDHPELHEVGGDECKRVCKPTHRSGV